MAAAAMGLSSIGAHNGVDASPPTAPGAHRLGAYQRHMTPVLPYLGSRAPSGRPLAPPVPRFAWCMQLSSQAGTLAHRRLGSLGTWGLADVDYPLLLLLLVQHWCWCGC